MSITAIIVADSVSRTYGDSQMNRLGIIAATLSALPAMAAVRVDGYDLATDDGDKTVVVTRRQPKAKVRPVLIDRVRAEPAVKSNSLKRLLKQKGRK